MMVACQTILRTLKFQYVIESNIMTKGIAIVKSTANKSSCNSFGDSKKHIPANTAKITIVIKAATTSLLNMLSKIKIIIKGDSYVPCLEDRCEILAELRCRKKQSSLPRCFCEKFCFICI